jgi:hypothetical protein
MIKADNSTPDANSTGVAQGGNSTDIIRNNTIWGLPINRAGSVPRGQKITQRKPENPPHIAQPNEIISSSIQHQPTKSI